MKLFTAPWCGSTHAPLAEETALLHYAPTHAFDNPAEVTITLSDPTGLIAQKYGVTYAAVGGAVADDGGVETDETAEANESTSDDMTLLPAAPISGDAYYIGFASTFKGLSLNVSTAGVGTWIIIWEYSQGGDSWQALSDVTDDTTGFTVAGTNSVVWTVPSDWATDTVGAIANMYWIRGRYGHFAHTSSPKGQQAWIHETYLGSGRVKIEDPTGTAIFEGRIMTAEANTDARTLTLYCQDWLSQLDEKQITYDMREKLSGNIRESTGHADPDGAFVDVAQNDAGTFYFFDDDMAWANDAYNGMYLIFTSGMAGKKTWTFHPFDATVSAGVTGDGDHEALWLDDSTVAVMFDNVDWTVDYDFRVYLGNDLPSDFYVHSSISAARVICVHQITVIPSTNHAHIQIYDNDAAGWEELEHLIERDVFHQGSHDINIDVLPFIVDNDGILTVRYDVDRVGGNATLILRYLAVEIEVETTGYSSAVLINDTIATNKLEVATDLTAAATRVWERIPYCIARPMYKHIASDETPGNLITDGDDLVTLTCAATIEHTSGISTRQYVDKTRWQILKDLARQDKAHLWMALATTTVIYKSTFNDGAPETLTDTDWNSCTGRRDYSTLANEVKAYGMRIGDNRLSSTYTDTTSEATYGATRTKVTSDTGLVSEYDTLARATALVNQYKDLQQILTCTIRGNTATAAHDKTLVLGDEVSITSSYLGLSSAVYIVQRWSYDSKSNLTTLLLHPRVSQVGLQRDERPSFEMVMQDFRRGTADRYIAAPETNEVA